VGRDRIEQQRRSSGPSVAPARSASLPGFGRGAASTASYGRCPNLGRCLDAAVAAGDAISFGRTSDETALVVTVLRNRTQEKAYPHTQEQLNDLIDGLLEYYAPVRSMPNGPAASS